MGGRARHDALSGEIRTRGGLDALEDCIRIGLCASTRDRWMHHAGQAPREAFVKRVQHTEPI
jgi:hypothetical protein